MESPQETYRIFFDTPFFFLFYFYPSKSAFDSKGGSSGSDSTTATTATARSNTPRDIGRTRTNLSTATLPPKFRRWIHPPTTHHRRSAPAVRWARLFPLLLLPLAFIDQARLVWCEGGFRQVVESLGPSVFACSTGICRWTVP